MKAKYDKIGTDYNLTRNADRFLIERFVHYLHPIKNGKYVDIGCGTGNYTIELQKQGYHFIGIDPSQKMLEIAKLRNQEIEWKTGSAENTGLPEVYVDGIMASLTIHHWTNLSSGFAELHRILKPGGRMVIFTSTPKQMKTYWLNRYFPNMLSDSIMQMPDLETVLDAMKDSGFEFLATDKYFIKPDLQDLFLYCGKHNPEIYFDEQVRNGISSFSSLSNHTEVEQGLLALRKDIDSGEIREIITSYDNDYGDYLFIIGNASRRKEKLRKHPN